MATKRDIVDDIRSVYPNAGLLCRAEATRYIRKHVRSETSFFDGMLTVPVDGREKYLVIDIADKLYRSQAGAS